MINSITISQALFTLKNIVGVCLVITGIFDAWKYVWQAQKIRVVKTAKGQSRKFINAAILNDLTRIAYSILIMDLYLMFINAVALSCMFYLFFTIYIFYPYRNRNLLNFRRPNILLYLINSIVPNKLRKKL